MYDIEKKISRIKSTIKLMKYQMANVQVSVMLV